MEIDRQRLVKSLFTAESARVETNRGEEYYSNLLKKCRARLDELQKLPPISNRTGYIGYSSKMRGLIEGSF